MVMLMTKIHPFAELRRIRNSDLVQSRRNRGNRVTRVSKPLKNKDKPVTPEGNSGYPCTTLGVTENTPKGNHYIEQNQTVTDQVTPVTPVTPNYDRARNHSDDWLPGDWQVFYDERAGIAEYEAGISRQEAESSAFESCVVEWINRNPEPSDTGTCLHCGQAERSGARIIPFSTKDDARAWLHSECWRAWHNSRRRAAIRALSSAGLPQWLSTTGSRST